jgi:putative transposase
LEGKRAMIEPSITISINRQCELLQIHRSGLYYSPATESKENLHLMRLMDEQYYHTPFYGIRRLTAWLKTKGYNVNGKRIKRLMKLIGWQTLNTKRNTSKPNKENPAYPYLLKGLDIKYRNQVWVVDITYLPMRKGFMYLCAILDLHTRFVVNWSISNTMTATWCRQVMDEAIARYGKPEIINSDQGSQFTSNEWIEACQGIQISMDGKGRCIDNIFIERFWKSLKYECVYLHSFEDGVQLYNGLSKYIHFYNYERLHQSLNYQTPAARYRKAA